MRNSFIYPITICLLLCLNLFTLNSSIYSQSISEIRSSGNYIYGIGESEFYEKADNQALSNLISKINIEIQSETKFIQSENNVEYNEYAESVIKTYSSATLNMALSIEEEKNGKYFILRYITKENFNKIFEERKKLIIDYTKAGLSAENKNNISDALRNLYWANLLLITHPKSNNISYNNKLLKVFLPNKIEKILSDLTAFIDEYNFSESEKSEKYTLSIFYKNTPIDNIDYEYKTSTSWSGAINSNNGLAYAEFYNVQKPKQKKVRLKVEYSYANKSYFDNEVKSIFDTKNIERPHYNNIIKVKNKKNDVAKPKHNLFEISVPKIINKNTSDIINHLKNNKKDINKSIFTKDGLYIYNKLLKYGNAEPLLENNDFKVIKSDDKFYVRSVPMQFRFSKNTQFTENVVFECNKMGQIENINFSLGQTALNDLLSKEERFATKREKLILINFLENYKTAYCLKNIDYLNNVFDDNALIIVGNVLRKKGNKDTVVSSILSDKEIKYQKLSKSEYISRLKHVFNSNEFINIHFEDNTIKKVKKDMSIYGIQIAQHYNSRRYSDRGYLFLLVDLRNQNEPVIHVRTWQPGKTKIHNLYNENNFPFSNL